MQKLLLQIIWLLFCLTPIYFITIIFTGAIGLQPLFSSWKMEVVGNPNRTDFFESNLFFCLIYCTYLYPLWLATVSLLTFLYKNKITAKRLKILSFCCGLFVVTYLYFFFLIGYGFTGLGSKVFRQDPDLYYSLRSFFTSSFFLSSSSVLNYLIPITQLLFIYVCWTFWQIWFKAKSEMGEKKG